MGVGSLMIDPYFLEVSPHKHEGTRPYLFNVINVMYNFYPYKFSKLSTLHSANSNVNVKP